MSYERVIFVAGLNEVVHGSKRSNIGVSTVYSPILQRNLGDVRQLQGKVFIYIYDNLIIAHRVDFYRIILLFVRTLDK